MAEADTEHLERPALPVDKTVAALLLSIDQNLAASVLRLFGDDSVDRVTRAMQELQELAVDRETMRSIMVKAFGEDRGSSVTRRANNDILAKRPFAMFTALTPGDLASLLVEEHPQIAAVFMAH